jgi:hypothetical protein
MDERIGVPISTSTGDALWPRRARGIAGSAFRALVAFEIGAVVFSGMLILAFFAILPVLALLAGVEAAAVTVAFALAEPLRPTSRLVRTALAGVVSGPIAVAAMSYLSARATVPSGYPVAMESNIAIGVIPAMLGALIYGSWLPRTDRTPRPLRPEDILTMPPPPKRRTRPVASKGRHSAGTE